MPQSRPQQHAAIRPLLAVRAAGDNRAEVFIYGDIGESWFGESVTAKDFVEQIGSLKGHALDVRINSYGGSVSDGLAIYNALKRHDSEVAVTIDGVAVSIASLIAMAGSTVHMADNALLMVHAPWSLAMGNAVELRVAADVLDTYARAMATSYAAKTGKSIDDMLALLSDGVDHWYTAVEAVDAGFADAVAAPDETAAAAHGFQPALCGLGRYAARAPERIAAALRMPPAAAPMSTVSPTQPVAASTGVRVMPNANLSGTSAAPAAAASTPASAAAAPAASSDSDIMAQIKDRNARIQAKLEPFKDRPAIQALLAQAMADPAMSEQAVADRAMELLAAAAQPIGGASAVRVEHGASDHEKFVAGVQASLMARAGLAKDDPANNYRGYSLVEIARASVERAGRSTRDMSKLEVVGAGFTSTSDFPSLLSNIANKALLLGWGEAPETFDRWTRPGVLTDFKPTKRVDLNEFSALAVVPQDGEYKQGTIGDRGETITLATYGRLFGISRQSIINDDLGAFTRIPRKMGMAARRTIGNLVYAVLTSNPAMADGVALFNAAHNNLAGAGTVISTASVDAARQAIAKQKDPAGNVAALNIPMKYLIVPVALGGAGRQVANAEYEVGAATKNNTVPNYVRGLFEVVEDARLDAASAISWYAAADGQMFDTIEVAYLDGQQTPFLEQQDGWKVDGVEFKVRIDAGVKALDHRTLYKNPGA